MKSYYVHYMNKYPGGRVDFSDSHLNAFDAEGRHCVALKVDGSGMWKDVSKELGCAHEHDLSPIPKDARLMKLGKDHKVAQDEKHAERSELVSDFMDDGRVLSCEQLSAEGMKFDEKFAVIK